MGISDALERLSRGVGARDIFAVERTQRAGSPALWEEVISLHAGGQQRYLRVRSQADEGGAPIGRWWAPAPAGRATALATALRDAAIWTLSDEPVAPGEEIITWRWVTGAGVGKLSVPAGSPTLRQLAPLDLELRRVANALTRGHGGVELTCQVSILDQAEAGLGTANIWLVNDGDQDCLVENPLRASARGSDFCRLELGHLPEEEEGVTGLGIRYGALAMPTLSSLPPPWDSSHLMLRAGDFLECPLAVPLRPPLSGRHFLRAVYSRYGTDDEIGGVPVVRGRAFSEEHEVELADGKLRIKGAPEHKLKPAGTELMSTEVEGAPAVMPPPSTTPPPSPKPPRPPMPNPDLLKTRIDKK
jgi:hypothetical protein